LADYVCKDVVKAIVIPSITADLIESATDDELWAVLDKTLHDHLGREGYADAALETLPRGLQLVWHFLGIEFEVPNGGFSQFFYNSTGAFALDTLEALKTFGLSKRASALDQALALFEDAVGRPRSSRERWQTGEYPADDATEKVDGEYYRAQESEGTESVIDYIRAHPGDFV
jgi:hypothetical protein